MKHSIILLAATLLPLLSPAAPAAEPAFTRKPEAIPEKNGVRIGFAVNGNTDATVLIKNRKGRTVRHLASGVLGLNAPAPFQAGAFEQSILWDGTDDLGQPLPAERYKVHVLLGLKPRFGQNIGWDRQWLGTVHGLAVGGGGEVYVYGSRGICVLDRKGRYQRQIVPAPRSLPPEKLAGLGPVTLADGTVFFTRSYPLPGGNIGAMALSSAGELLLPGPARYARQLTRIGTDGSVPASTFDSSLTRLSDDGFLHLAASPDARAVYMAGAEAGYRGDDARKVSYRQAVYRLLTGAPGPAEIFTGDDENTGGPGFSVSTPKGLATDSQGNLYVCNYGRDDVAVYTPGAGMIRTIKVKHPQQVAVHPTTGQLYVLAGREEGRSKYGYDYPPVMREARLHRFSARGEPEIEMAIEPPFIKQRKEGPNPEFRLRLAVDFSARKPVAWVGVAYPDPTWSKFILLRIADDGREFDKPEEVSPKPDNAFLGGVQHFSLDRDRDILYVSDGGRLMRYTGSGGSLPPLKFTNEAGKRYNICEAAIGPGGNIHLLAFQEYGYQNNFILRYDPEGKSLPFPAGGSNGVSVSHVMKGGGGRSTRGLTVDARGNVYVLHYDRAPGMATNLPAWDAGFPLHTVLSKFDVNGNPASPFLISHLRSGAQCVRVDPAGNILVADNIMPVGVTYPRDFVGALPDPLSHPHPARTPDGGFDPLLRHMGSVIQFGPEGGTIAGLPEGAQAQPAPRPDGDTYKPVPETQWMLFHNHRLQVTGARWQHHGISPMPAQYQGVTHVERCVCLGARFDVDPLGRVFIPDALRHRVTVLDSAGNLITRFGERDNQDANGPHIGLTEPGWVCADVDRAYVADGSAARIVKVLFESAAEASCTVTR